MPRSEPRRQLPKNVAQDLPGLDRASILHPATALDQHQNQGQAALIIERGSGIAVTDIDGKRYVDAGAGLWCVNVGYGREELGRVADDEMSSLGYYHSFAGA